MKPDELQPGAPPQAPVPGPPQAPVPGPPQAPVMGAPQAPVIQAPIGDKPQTLGQQVADAAKDKLKEKATDAAWSWVVSTLWPFVFGATAGAITGAGAGVVMAHIATPTASHEAPMVTMIAQASDGGVPALSGMGVITVLSLPAAGHVTLDGRIVGVTPIERLDVLPGTHAIVVEETGYQPYTGNVVVAPGARVPVVASLLPALAAVDAGAPSVRHWAGGGGGGGYRPPARDCYGEERDCKNRCGHAETSCEMSCFGCSGCNTSLTSEQCADRCRQCREGCDQNGDFCESSCEGQRQACSGG